MTYSEYSDTVSLITDPTDPATAGLGLQDHLLHGRREHLRNRKLLEVFEFKASEVTRNRDSEVTRKFSEDPSGHLVIWKLRPAGFKVTALSPPCHRLVTFPCHLNVSCL